MSQDTSNLMCEMLPWWELQVGEKLYIMNLGEREKEEFPVPEYVQLLDDTGTGTVQIVRVTEWRGEFPHKAVTWEIIPEPTAEQENLAEAFEMYYLDPSIED